MMKFLILFFLNAWPGNLAIRLATREEGIENSCSPEVKSILQKHAVNNTVVFTALDIADDYVPIIKNYACGVRRVGLPLLIWSMNEKTHAKMAELGLTDLYVEPDKSFASVKPYGKDYLKIVQSKPKLMQTVINCGFDVLYLDSDLGFGKNPLPYFLSQEGDVQMTTNWPHEELNTGVNYIRNKPSTRALMSAWVQKTKEHCRGYECGDQEQLTDVMTKQCSMKLSTKDETAKLSKVFRESKKHSLSCSFKTQEDKEENQVLNIELLPPTKFPDSQLPSKHVEAEAFTYHPNFSGLNNVIWRKTVWLKHTNVNGIWDGPGQRMWCADEDKK